jgi:ketosteroid isomerase-like protein
MSRENVEIVRQGWEVFEADGLDAWLKQFVAPDAIFIQDDSVVPDAQTWTGWDGWRAAVTAWSEEFDGWRAELHEVLDAGVDRVVVTWRDHGRGRRSGVVVERPEAAFIHTLRDGRIVHTVQYERAERALEAVGLSE